MFDLTKKERAHPVSISLYPVQISELRFLAKAAGVPFSHLVRQAIEIVIDELSPKYKNTRGNRKNS